LSMLRNGAWTLSNLCRGKPAPPFEFVKIALPLLARLIFSTDEEVLTDALWALSYLSDGSNDKIQAVIEAGIARRVVELLVHHATSVQVPALRTVGNIVTGDDLQTQVMLNCSLLPCLLPMLSHPKLSIQKEACWVASNLTSGNTSQIQAVIDANMVPILIHQVQFADPRVQREANWAIANATSGGTVSQIQFLVELGCIPPMVKLLESPDQKVSMVSLEGLENIMKVAQKVGDLETFCNNYGFMTAIEKLASADPRQGVAQKAAGIIECFFPDYQFSFVRQPVDPTELQDEVMSQDEDLKDLNELFTKRVNI